MKKILIPILLILVLLTLIAQQSYAKDRVSISYSEGEWQNKYETSNTEIEMERFIADNTYLIVGQEFNSHPVEQVKNFSWVGAGYVYDNIYVALKGGEDIYKFSAGYESNKERVLLRSEFYVSDGWDSGFMRTGLRVGGGYQLTQRISSHIFYQVQNTTQKYINDLYGVQLELQF